MKNKFKKLILIFLVTILYSFIGKPVISLSEVKKQPIYNVDTAEKKLSLTFDVNWAEKDYLYEILDILDKHNVKATFFVMGKWVIYPEENKEKLKEINKRGHEIGNHSFIHPDFTKISKERAIKEIKETEDIISKEIGLKTELFRFPSGSYNEDKLRVSEELGYKNIHWNVDSIDWKNLGLDKEYNRVIKNIIPGSIVLFHNNGKNTPKNLEKLIPYLKKEGYNFFTIGELIFKENYEINSEGLQKLLQ
ncbi:polysaccharide deacetylase family protein [Clostridium tarantellae]|uniref:Polysaccharide deacetylase family protein n=1 Tax=Clostridium tarantellae TaxID=39493 RepID=A0A6I1MIY0_9CLOT|nr:polysaccharide deacetylase family protein [Clostridium tarantellae]